MIRKIRVTAVAASFLGLAGILLAQVRSQVSPGPAPAGEAGVKTPPEDLYYYGGETGKAKIPLAFDGTLLSVGFKTTLGLQEARQTVLAAAGVDPVAAGQLELTEKNSAYVPLLDGLSPGSAQTIAGVLAADPAVDYAEPVYQSGEQLGGTNRLIVKFADFLGDREVGGLLGAFGLQVVKPLASGPNTFVLEVPKGSVYNALEMANLFIEAFGNLIDYAHPDFRVERKSTFTPNDTFYGNQWHLNSTGQGGAKVDADIDAPEAWDLTQGLSTVVVAVIDTGMDLVHEDLVYVQGWDAVGNDSNPGPGSGEHHATAVAGVAAAKGNNAKGVSGSCPNCKVMPIRLIVSGMQISDEAEAFNYAWQNGAAIINNSWGPVGSVGSLPPSTKAAIDAAVTQGRGGKGCVIFFAAGNDNTSMDQNGYAAYSKVIAVGASTDQDLKAWYSNTGTKLDICAPSDGGVTSGIWTTDRTGSVGYSSTNYTSAFGGTSSASPLAGGVAGLMLSVNANLTYTDVRTHLINTADKIDQAGGGWSGGFSTKYGYGKVNARAAVQAAQGGGGGGTTQTFSSTDVPKSIPDNNTTGVTSNLPISTTGTVNSVSVNVNITHTYKGDLKVTLIHPDGTNVILHNQTGGSADNIITSYPVPTAPYQSLTVLNGKALNGTWKLKVQDLVALDVGTLNSWSLTINYTPGGGGGGSFNFSSTDVPKSIPDNNTTGVTSNLTASNATGTVVDVNVTVNITHTYKGDLKVTLIHPDGTNVILHNRTGGSADNIITTYDTLTVPYQSLTVLNGKNPNGLWKLKVQDLAAIDVGTLNSWSINVVTQ